MLLWNKQTILIVEDDADQRSLLQQWFELEGYSVITADGGAAALELIARCRPDLILTDLWMPEMDGIELIRRLRSRADFTEIPIVALSAVHVDLPKAMATGADGAAQKPIDLDGLTKLIKRLLSRVKTVVQENAKLPPLAALHF